MITIHVEGYRLTQSRLNSLARTAKAAVINGGGIGWDTRVSEPSLKEYFKEAYKNPLITLILAVEDATDTVVGSVQLQRFHHIHSASAQHRADVLRFFVHPTMRRMGIGKRLLEALERNAKGFGIRFLFLDVRETQEAAHALYIKMGFTEYTRKPYYAEVDGVMCKGILMFKEVLTEKAGP